MTAPPLDRETILKAIQQLPPAEQVSVAQDIMRLIARPAQQRQQQPASRAPLRGILANGQPPPSDEEIARRVDEHRMEKYGG